MPRKPSLKPVINLDEEDDEEDEAAFNAEEAQMRAARLQKELEEQNKFDCLCDGVNSAMALVDAAFNGLLELKDELVTHELPPSLLVAILLTTGKMYRSITDLHTPVRELTRLVNVYSVPWDQKSEALKKLHTDYESKQRQLNIAIRKLQLIDASARRMEREKIISNWEKVFAKVTEAKTHGRRWKFVIQAFKKKVEEGFVFTDMETEDDDDDDSDAMEDEEIRSEQDEAVAEKQRFMMSVITASPPQEEDTGSQAQGSDIGSEADGIPSEVTESSGNAEEMSPDLQLKPKRHGVSFGAVDEMEEEIVIKPEMKEIGVWTHEPEYETQLAVRVYRPLELKDDNGQDISCSFSLGGKSIKSGVLPLPNAQVETLTVPEEPVEVEDSTKTKAKGGSRRKSIGFASRPTSPPPPSSPKANVKPSSILKKVKADEEEDVDKKEEILQIDRSAYQEVLLDFPERLNPDIRIAVLQGEKESMISMSLLNLKDIDMESIPTKFAYSSTTSKSNDNEGNADEETEKAAEPKEDAQDLEGDPQDNSGDNFENQLQDAEPIFVDLQGIKVGIGGHGHSMIGRLPLILYFVKKEIKRSADAEVNTESIKELVKDVVGIDMEEISKDELMQILGREYHDVCTSAMSFASSSSHKSGFIAAEEMEAIREQHDKELHNLQAEYEIKLQQLLAEMEQMQHTRARTPVQQQLTNQQMLSNDIAMLSEQQVQQPVIKEEELKLLAEKAFTAMPLKRQKWPPLPDWGAHLPKNVWVRMKMLTEEMIEKRQQLESRIRRQIASNIEKKLASQYKLQRANNTLRGPLQDVSLPAVFMPSKSGNVYNPRAHMYFHPAGTSGDLRLSQPPSIFQLPPLPEKAKMSVVNLFDLSKNFQHHTSTDWLNRIASAPLSKGSRATTAATKASRFATPTTPAPTANIPAYDA